MGASLKYSFRDELTPEFSFFRISFFVSGNVLVAFSVTATVVVATVVSVCTAVSGKVITVLDKSVANARVENCKISLILTCNLHLSFTSVGIANEGCYVRR